jgi:AcrR family transcriptional regulator
MPTPAARDRILETATRLFDRHGVHAVGMQQIIDDCGCGKNLLYAHFASKDDLVVAYLRRRGDDWQDLFDAAKATTSDPADQLVELVCAVGARAVAPGSRGCPLRTTLAEFADFGHPVHRVAEAHFVRVRAQLRGLAGKTGAADPDRLADRFMLILDGLYANGPAFGEAGAKTAVAFAEDVLRSAARARPRGSC